MLTNDSYHTRDIRRGERRSRRNAIADHGRHLPAPMLAARHLAALLAPVGYDLARLAVADLPRARNLAEVARVKWPPATPTFAACFALKRAIEEAIDLNRGRE